MVKGISKQVIVVQSADRKLFEQAIFILSDEAVRGEAVTDDMLLREARQLISSRPQQPKRKGMFYPIGFSAAGAVATGLVWLLTAIL